MAWADTFLRPSFRGVPFDVVNVARAGDRDVVTHRIPYANGAQNEDLGLGPRRVRLQAVFFGADYEDRLFALITALETPGVGELIHPIHGSMQVLPTHWSDDHEADLVDGAVLSIEFLEDSLRDEVFAETSTAAKTDAIATGAQEARASADDALARLVQQIPRINIPRITILKNLFGQVKGALGILLSRTTGIKVLLSDLDPLIYPRSYANDLVTMVDQALQGLPFGGLNVRYSSASGGTRTTSTALGDFGIVRSTLDPQGIVLTPAVAQPDAESTADAAAVQAHARAHAATAIAECAAIVLAGELEQPTLDRADIEAMCNQVRAGLQLAIDGARSSLDAEGRAQTSIALRELAWQVQEAARAVINQRPPLVRKPAPLGGPARLVAHAFYGDPTRATEISRLNRLGRRVFIEAGEALNVYSS